MQKQLKERSESSPVNPVWGLAAIALAATLWALGGNVASDLFQSGVRPFELAMARALIAAVGLAIMTKAWEQPRKPRLDWSMLVLGLSIALVTFTYYVAIARLSIAVAIVIQYTAPAMVVAWGVLKARQMPSRSVSLALLGAIAGVVLISELFSGDFQLDSLGLIMAGLSALFFATYTLLSEVVVPTYGPMGVMFRAFTVSSLFWLAFQLSQGWPQAIFAPDNFLGILFVGVGGTLVPFSLFCWGIQHVRSERAAIAATLEPVIAAIVAWWWLGQALTPLQLIGGALVLLAVISLQIRQAPA